MELTIEQQVVVDQVLAAIDTPEESEVVTGVLLKAGLLELCAFCREPRRVGQATCVDCAGRALRGSADTGEPAVS